MISSRTLLTYDIGTNETLRAKNTRGVHVLDEHFSRVPGVYHISVSRGDFSAVTIIHGFIFFENSC